MVHSSSIAAALENISKKFGGRDDDSLTIVDSLDQLSELLPEIRMIDKSEITFDPTVVSNDSTFLVTKHGKLVTINARVVLKANISRTSNFVLFSLPEECYPPKAVVLSCVLWSNASGTIPNDYGIAKASITNNAYVMLEPANDLLNKYNVCYINVTYHTV